VHSRFTQVAFILACTTVALRTVQPAAAVTAMAPPERSATLAGLEKKFFGHQFPAELDSIRLDRLDKVIFGEFTTGSADERLSHIEDVLAVSAVNVKIKDPGFHVLSAPERPLGPPPSASFIPAAGVHAYPRVLVLEKLLLGKTFPTEPVSQRLQRMELKVFGKTRTAMPLLQRVETLELQHHVQYIYLIMDNQELTSIDSMQRYLKNPLGFAQKYPKLINSSTGLADWLDVMEQQFLGKTSPTDALLDRVTRLEMRVFAAPNKDALLMRRIHDLMAKLGPEQYPVQVADTKGSAPKSPAPKPKQIAASSAFQVPFNPAVARIANRSQTPLLNAATRTTAVRTALAAPSAQPSASNQVDGFKLPINPGIVPKPPTITVNGFQMPVNPALPVVADNSPDLGSFSTIRSKHSILHKLTKALQIASGALDSGSSSVLYADDSFTY
jgi:hypothetical protein